MDFSFKVPDAAMRSKDSLARATNSYGDLVHWVLHLRDIQNDWRPTVDKVKPQVRLTLTEGYLSSGVCAILLKPDGRDGSNWLWRMTLDCEQPMAAMPASDRQNMDALINALFDCLHYVRQQNECCE